MCISTLHSLHWSIWPSPFFNSSYAYAGLRVSRSHTLLSKRERIASCCTTTCHDMFGSSLFVNGLHCRSWRQFVNTLVHRRPYTTVEMGVHLHLRRKNWNADDNDVSAFPLCAGVTVIPHIPFSTQSRASVEFSTHATHLMCIWHAKLMKLPVKRMSSAQTEQESPLITPVSPSCTDS